MAICTQTEVTTYLQAASGITLSAAALAWVTQCWPFTEGLVKKFLGFDVELNQYTQYYPEVTRNNLESDQLIQGYEQANSGIAYPYRTGDFSQTMLQLRQLPVRSIVSVYENPAAWLTPGGSFPAGNLIDASQYYLDLQEGDLCWSGQLLRNIGTWTTTRRGIKVTYWAGLSPPEIAAQMPGAKMAVLTAVAWGLIEAVRSARATFAGGVASHVSIKDFSVGYAIPPQQVFSIGLPPAALKYLEPYLRWSQYL